MNRRQMLTALAVLPATATTLHVPEAPFGEVKVISACGSSLYPQMFRAAIDTFGEECEVTGHAAQRNMWEQARLLIANSGYSHEFNERSCNYFMGQKFTTDNSLPLDIVEFSRNGHVIGVIRNLGIPAYGYGR